MPKLFVFTLMPFDEKFDDVYKLGIKSACQELSLYCERVDEQIFEESILERIYNQIVKADIIIADLSNKNPNVFYETGYAHALNKKVILLTQSSNDIPFDLKHYPHIIYEGKISLLKDELIKRLNWYISHPKETEMPNVNSLVFYLNREKVTDKPIISLIECDINSDAFDLRCGFRFDISIHNNSNVIFDGNISIALKASNDFATCFDNYKTIKLPDGDNIYSIMQLKQQYPNEWTKTTIELCTYDFSEEFEGERIYDVELILYSSIGSIKYPFQLKLSYDNVLRKSMKLTDLF